MQSLTAAAAAMLCVAALVCYHSSDMGGVSTLLSVRAIHEQATADAKSFGSAFRAARVEKLSDKTQKKLANKDATVQKSLELAAAEQTVAAKQAEFEFEKAKKDQAVLDRKLAMLSEKMASQKRQLTVALQEMNGKEMMYKRASMMVPQLTSGLHRVRDDEAKIEKEKQANAKAIKPIQTEISDVKSVLKKSEDALTEDRMRTQYDARQGNYAIARKNLEMARARVAAKQAAFFTQKAEEQSKGQGQQRSKFLKEAQAEHDKTSLLQAKSAEDAQKSEVWHAKAAEAASGMRMMEADVMAARHRLQQETMAQSRVHQRLGLGMMQHADQVESARLAAARRAEKQLGSEVRELEAVVRRGEAELGGSEQAFIKVRAGDLSARRREMRGEASMNGDLRTFTRDVEEAKDLQEADELHEKAAARLGAAAKEAAQVAADSVHGGVQEMQLGKFAAGEQTDLRQLQRLRPRM